MGESYTLAGTLREGFTAALAPEIPVQLFPVTQQGATSLSNFLPPHDESACAWDALDERRLLVAGAALRDPWGDPLAVASSSAHKLHNKEETTKERTCGKRL